MKKTVIIYILVLVIIFFGIEIKSKTIWKDSNIYSSSGNIRIGDIIVVNVTDISTMRFNLNLNSETTSDLSSNPDVQITGFLPKVTSNNKLSYTNSVRIIEAGQLNFSIASRITRKGRGRTFIINGSRTFSFNGISNRISISGVVDPELIDGRTLNSANIADFRIDIRGSREGIKIRRKKLKEKESAESKLT